MTPTLADLAAALETVRRNTQRPPGSPGRSLEYAEYTDACELIARHVAENAGRLRVVKGLEWKSTGGGNGWYARTVFDTIIRLSREGEWWYANDDYSKCRSEDRAKERADERYAARLAAALAPAFPEVEGKK